MREYNRNSERELERLLIKEQDEEIGEYALELAETEEEYSNSGERYQDIVQALVNTDKRYHHVLEELALREGEEREWEIRKRELSNDSGMLLAFSEADYRKLLSKVLRDCNKIERILRDMKRAHGFSEDEAIEEHERYLDGLNEDRDFGEEPSDYDEDWGEWPEELDDDLGDEDELDLGNGFLDDDYDDYYYEHDY